MKHRMTLGHDADAAETAALTLADDRATERIVEALDWEDDEKCRKAWIDNAVRRLSGNDRAFAKAVLGGKSWKEIGVSKQLFSWRLKKLENFFRCLNKG